MSDRCMLVTKLLSLGPLRDIIVDNIAHFGPPNCNAAVSYQRIGGKTAKSVEVVLVGDTVNVVVNRKELQDFKVFWKHASLTRNLTSRRLKQLLEGVIPVDTWGYKDSACSLFLISGINYSANEESGLGNGKFYATEDFNGRGPRHDFVEVQLRAADDSAFTQIAQTIALFEYVNERGHSKFIALVQFLEECPRAVLQKYHKECTSMKKYHPIHFKLMTWERANDNRPVMQVVEIEAIQGAAFVQPYFSTGTTPLNSTSKFSDLYWYVNRKFVDRSDWEDTVHQDWLRQPTAAVGNRSSGTTRSHYYDLNITFEELCRDAGEKDLDGSDEEDEELLVLDTSTDDTDDDAA
jgi:hypothetical protein